MALTGRDFDGLCSICGAAGTFVRGDHRSVRESYPCPKCRFTLRWRDQAGVILDEFARGQAVSLDALIAKGLLDTVDIFEPALRGPFVRRFRGLPGYVQSYFTPELPLGSTRDDGVRNEDLTQLTFADDSFDLVITSDVMEHLPDIEAAFAEILRVLRPGGCHVCSIPNDFPFPETTSPRVEIRDGQEFNLKPPVYHNSGDGSTCLVYTDYGADLTDLIRSLGGHLSVVRRSGVLETCNTNATFVMRKLGPVTAARQTPRTGAAAPASPTVTTKDQSPMTATKQCPICDGTTFLDFGGRKDARCSTCQGVERTRLMYMAIERLGGFEAGKRVLHFAPELGLGRRFLALSGEKYHPVDLDPERYKSKVFTVGKMDMCSDLAGIADDSYDLIVHSHVLEHVPCDVTGVLQQLDRILAPGGLHFLCVPIRGDETIEDLSASLTDAERMERFGQEDHVRVFGSRDLQAQLAQVWGPEKHLIDPLALFEPEVLRRAAIPAEAWKGVSGHSIFCYRKGGQSPADAKSIPVTAAPARAPKAPPSFPKEDVFPGSKITHGLKFLRRDNPWPEFPWGEHAPFMLALDANGRGGREIITREIVDKNVTLMAEVGCFLGGSVRHWLDAKPDLTVIGVDPWDGNWAAYIERMVNHPQMARHVWHMDDAEVARIVQMLRQYGNYGVALNNLRLYKERFIPVRRFSPEALFYLSERQIPIEMIYIDAFKHRDDLDAAYAYYPNAILSGDDWLWPDETGKFVMQDHIKAFAHEHGFEIESSRQTWLLHR